MSRLLFLVCAVRLFASSCQPVEGASILARDIARAIPAFSPAFSKLDPETEILAGPVAGVQRIVLGGELLQLARKFHAEEEGLPSSACFEQATEPLTPSVLLPALQAAFTDKDVSIEILEFSNTAVPHGKLQFTLGGLQPSGLWHGRMAYGPGRSVNVWAKVSVMEKRTWVEAAELLPAGRIIRADQLTMQTGLRSPLDPAPAESLESVVGKKPLRTLAPGVAIRPQLLIEPPQVERGDKVEVQVESGDAHLQFEAEAENPGHIGDLVFLRNPENGHRFQARVEGKGKVAIRK
jgi:flagella basal body P-ring formation protein FlgA